MTRPAFPSLSALDSMAALPSPLPRSGRGSACPKGGRTGYMPGICWMGRSSTVPPLL